MSNKDGQRSAIISFRNAADAQAAQHKYHNIPLDGAPCFFLSSRWRAGARMSITFAAEAAPARVPIMARFVSA
jgi:hypothetical protein